MSKLDLMCSFDCPYKKTQHQLFNHPLHFTVDKNDGSCVNHAIHTGVRYFDVATANIHSLQANQNSQYIVTRAQPSWTQFGSRNWKSKFSNQCRWFNYQIRCVAEKETCGRRKARYARKTKGFHHQESTISLLVLSYLRSFSKQSVFSKKAIWIVAQFSKRYPKITGTKFMILTVFAIGLWFFECWSFELRKK